MCQLMEADEKNLLIKRVETELVRKENFAQSNCAPHDLLMNCLLDNDPETLKNIGEIIFETKSHPFQQSKDQLCLLLMKQNTTSEKYLRSSLTHSGVHSNTKRLTLHLSSCCPVFKFLVLGKINKEK